ncbi:MAG: hypothetical protein JL50_21090 [Peptococcaceae bacterium BICA1-7]|nr:MAG: hypothetical protein JL50_21090 [Peptococcaceae bacterium BICA1-7]
MKRDVKKDLITDAALSCFLASGYSGTSVDSIVKASGVSKGGIYWHFKSKEEIFLYLVQKWINERQRDFESRLKPEDTASEKLNKFVDCTLEQAKSPVPSLIHEFAMVVRDESVLNQIKDLMNNYDDDNILTAIINQGIESGEFRPLDARASAEVFRTLFEGIMMRCHFQHKDISLLRRIAKTAMNIYLEGLSNK